MKYLAILLCFFNILLSIDCMAQTEKICIPIENIVRTQVSAPIENQNYLTGEIIEKIIPTLPQIIHIGKLAVQNKKGAIKYVPTLFIIAGSGLVAVTALTSIPVAFAGASGMIDTGEFSDGQAVELGLGIGLTLEFVGAAIILTGIWLKECAYFR